MSRKHRKGNGNSPTHPVSAENRPTSQLQHITTNHETVYQGPIPQPSDLEHYDRICPGAANRILAMAEAENLHRRSQDNAVTEANIAALQQNLNSEELRIKSIFRSDMIGQGLGWSVTIVCISGAIYLAMHGQPWVAGLLLGPPIMGVIRALRSPRQSNKHAKE